MKRDYFHVEKGSIKSQFLHTHVILILTQGKVRVRTILAGIKLVNRISRGHAGKDESDHQNEQYGW